MVRDMLPTRQQEIDDFKQRINLTEYVAAQGYVLDRKESSRNSVTMRGPGGDKLIIGKDANSGHWIYFSVRNDADNGTIIDFVQNRLQGGLGAVRKALRPWVGSSPHLPRRPSPEGFVGDVEPISRDLAWIRAQVGHNDRHPLPRPATVRQCRSSDRPTGKTPAHFNVRKTFK